MGRKLNHPYFPKKRNPLWAVTHPFSVGTLTAAVSVAIPYGNLQNWSATILEKLPGGNHISARIPVALLGFLCGYSSVKGWHHLRMKMIKYLLSYFGWMTSPKSMKTKLWALALKFFQGPQPFSTFMFQPCLPKQPLPDLDKTLDRWLQVAEQLVSEEEFEQTKEVVGEFRRNEGPRLQKYLEEKARTEDNYIYHYWINAAYLASRQPLPVHSNYYVGTALPEARNTDQLTRAATMARSYAEIHQMLENKTTPPILLQEIVPLCMNGYKHIFNAVRVPGLVLDSLEKHPGKTHIIVIRKGQYYKMDLYYPGTKNSLLTRHEILEQLKYIVATADANTTKEPPVAALTGQKRHVWAEQRLKLMVRNKEILNDIESSMFILLLDDFTPKDFSDMGFRYLTGSLDNIWFDKCFNFMVFENAFAAGNVEHTAIDAMVFTSASEYTLFKETYENGKLPKGPPLRPIAQPQRLQWDIQDMESEINNAYTELRQLADDTEVHMISTKYSKGFMKKQRISPDGYIQMALQLAYYKLHNEIVKTYEPSTGRLFLLGRTETINPISSASRAWVKAMSNPNSSQEQKLKLLKEAVKYQTNYRLEATIGKACDRHLFALMCASRDLGMDFPKIFMDKSWQLPYILSTSQTPCYLAEYGLDLNYYAGCGGFGPSCPDGYGICYIIFGDDIMNIHISSWRSCSTTSSAKLGQAIFEAMDDMKALFK